ncbi:MAG: hypothetical protein R2682_01885 [Pyrinomonadaceae bacterium]
MNPRQFKNKLMDLGLTQADLAKKLSTEFPGATPKSMYTMLGNLVWGRVYYPRYANFLNEQFGFSFREPKRASAKELLQRAA